MKGTSAVVAIKFYGPEFACQSRYDSHGGQGACNTPTTCIQSRCLPRHPRPAVDITIGRLNRPDDSHFLIVSGSLSLSVKHRSPLIFWTSRGSPKATGSRIRDLVPSREPCRVCSGFANQAAGVNPSKVRLKSEPANTDTLNNKTNLE